MPASANLAASCLLPPPGMMRTARLSRHLLRSTASDSLSFRPTVARLTRAASTSSSNRSDLLSKPAAAKVSQSEEQKAPKVPEYPAVPFPGVSNWSLSIANAGDPITPYDIFGYPPDPPRPAEPVEPAEPAEPQPVVNTDALWTISAPSHYLLFGPVGYPAPPEDPPAKPSETAPAKMASDEDYAAFLDKASADRSGPATSQSKPPKGAQHTRVTTSAIPDVLQSVDAYYVSDADEPFEPVSLTRSPSASGTLSTAEVKQLIGASGHVEELSVKSFDPKGQYSHVVKTVEQAAGKDSGVKVWRVDAGGARAEYWLLAIESQSGHVVGLKATSIES